MAAGRTYTPIATNTLTSSSSGFTFSSIPATYTDLVLVIYMTPNSANNNGANIYFNGDNSGNYTNVTILGNGSTVSTYRYTASPVIYAVVTGNSNAMSEIIQIQNYSNTTTYKSVLARSNDSAGYTQVTAGVWRSTSAINSITITFQGGVAPGTTATLYGIAAA